MQLTLAFLEAPPPQPTLSNQLDAEARVEASGFSHASSHTRSRRPNDGDNR